MPKRLFAVLATVSLVLCALAVLLWVSGDRAMLRFRFEQAGDQWQVISERGEVWVNNQPQVDADGQASLRWSEEYKKRFEARRASPPSNFPAYGRAEKLRDRLNALKEARRRNPRLTVDQDRVHAEWSAQIDALAREVVVAESAETDELMAFYGPHPPRRVPNGISWRVARHEWLAAAFGVLPALWLGVTTTKAVRARRRRSATLCVRCGYDLRATPDRCPECGAVPAVTH